VIVLPVNTVKSDPLSLLDIVIKDIYVQVANLCHNQLEHSTLARMHIANLVNVQKVITALWEPPIQFLVRRDTTKTQ